MSHRDGEGSTGKRVDDIAVTLCSDCVYCGGHETMYRPAQSLCCAPRTNVTVYTNSTC